jgi:hypothetical protein
MKSTIVQILSLRLYEVYKRREDGVIYSRYFAERPTVRSVLTARAIVIIDEFEWMSTYEDDMPSLATKTMDIDRLRPLSPKTRCDQTSNRELGAGRLFLSTKPEAERSEKFV